MKWVGGIGGSLVGRGVEEKLEKEVVQRKEDGSLPCDRTKCQALLSVTQMPCDT